VHGDALGYLARGRMHVAGLDGALGVEVDVDQEVVVAQLFDQRVQLGGILVGGDEEYLLRHDGTGIKKVLRGACLRRTPARAPSVARRLGCFS
jgi:hypothetical protein